MQVKRINVGPLDANCYIVWDEETKDAAVIDPGGSIEKITAVIDAEGLDVKKLINTHGHFDHIGANDEAKERLGAPLAIHSLDVPILDNAASHAATFGLQVPNSSAPDILLKDGDIIEAGTIKIEVIHTPGHSEGGICLYIRDEGMLFTGDTLFAGSIGRTDLPGGSYDELMSSIKEKLLPLDGSTRVLPGHEGESTIDNEKSSNPYLKELL